MTDDDDDPRAQDAPPGTPPAGEGDDRLHFADPSVPPSNVPASDVAASDVPAWDVVASDIPASDVVGASTTGMTEAIGTAGAGGAGGASGRAQGPTRVQSVAGALAGALASVRASAFDGARRVLRAPAVLTGVWLVNLLLAVPFALAMRGAIERHFGASLVARDAAQGFSLDWWGELAARAEGLTTTFTASVIGFGAVLRNLSDLADAQAPIAPIAGAILLWLLAWTFLWGGILDRLARNRPTRAAGFFAACGAHAGRMLRLALMAGLAYGLLWRYVHPLLFDTLYGSLTHDLAVERTAFLVRLVLYALFGALVLGVRLLTDLARVRAVIEDRRSMMGAYLAGWRLLRARPLAILGIYALAGIALIVWLGLYASIAPGGRGSGIWVWLALLSGQIHLVGRLWLKLQIPAALIALYRAEIARGDLDLAPTPVWPESPAASGGVEEARIQSRAGM